MNTESRKRSGISVDRTYRIQTKIMARVKDIYSRAIFYNLTYESISDELAKVYNDPQLKLTPAYVKHHIFGYCEAKREEIYHHHVQWMLWLDGKLVTSEEVNSITKSEKPISSDRDYRTPWQRVDNEKSRHVWLKNGVPQLDRPLDRKFQEPKEG